MQFDKSDVFCCCCIVYLCCICVTLASDEGIPRENHDHVDLVQKAKFEWDPKGYVMFCLCMGRFGNQADHFLGAMAFAKAIDRTLILPQFRFQQHHRYSDLFKLEKIKEYHRVIEVEDFMEHLAPTYWPPGKRKAMCWLPQNSKEKSCRMKEGPPFNLYWNGLGIDFDEDVVYNIGYADYQLHLWNERYPVETFPVYAMRGAPAAFPVKLQHKHLQKYIEFTEAFSQVGDTYINENFPDEKFVGIHLRNGVDWKNACEKVEGMKNFMASPQCLEGTSQTVTEKLCFPSTKEILRLLKNVVMQVKAKVVYVATDQHPLIREIEDHLKYQKIRVYHMDPGFPLHDIYMLTKADHFIGNCVSSFTAFVKRHRDVHNLPSSFFGFS